MKNYTVKLEKLFLTIRNKYKKHRMLPLCSDHYLQYDLRSTTLFPST